MLGANGFRCAYLTRFEVLLGIRSVWRLWDPAMKLPSSLTFRGIVLVALPLIFGLLFLAVLSGALLKTEADLQRQMRSKENIAEANVVSRLLVQATLDVTNYAQTGSALWADKYSQKSLPELNRHINTLSLLPTNSADEAASLQRIKEKTSAGVQILDGAKRALDTQSESERKSLGRQLTKQTRAVAAVLDDEMREFTKFETEVAAQNLQAETKSRDLLKQILAAFVVLNIVLCTWLAFFFYKNITKRLYVMRDNSLRLSRGEVLNPALLGGDEIADLDAVFHQMADGLSEAQRKERALIENAVDVICSIDANGTFSEVSPACLDAWGYPSEELLGQRYINLVVDADKERTLAALNESMTNQAPFNIENRLKRSDGGRAVDLLWSGSWSKEDQSLFCVAHDVTTRKKMEQLKREFVQMVSHDLRMPLTSLKMTLGMLLEGTYGELTERGRPRIEYATYDLTRLINMINELLEFERMESGKIDLFLENSQVSDLVTQAVESVRSLAEKQKIKLYSQGADHELICDGGRLVQVMINLLGNAIKFSPKNSSIFVSANEIGETMEFKIRDEGKGIPAEFKDKIFDRFQQVELDDARVKGGSGLGLAICKAIIEEHKGTIGVQSEEGKGSTFWFRIPLSLTAK